MQLVPTCSSLWKCCLVLPLLLSSGACSSFKDVLPVTIKTVEIERNIPVQKRPRPLSLNNIHFYVVTQNNYVSFSQRFQKENGDGLVFYAVSVRDYETLSLNMSEIKRFLAQQKGIISYYELAVAPKESK
jgi:hypothetical protein